MGASTFSKRDLFMLHLNEIKNDYKIMSDNFYLVQKDYDKLLRKHTSVVRENEKLHVKLQEMSKQLQNTNSSIDTCSLIDNEHGSDMHCSVCHGEIDDVFRYLMDSHGYKRCPHCGRLIEDIDTGE